MITDDTSCAARAAAHAPRPQTLVSLAEHEINELLRRAVATCCASHADDHAGAAHSATARAMGFYRTLVLGAASLFCAATGGEGFCSF